MVIQGKTARRIIIISDYLQIAVRGHWRRKVDFHGDSGVMKATVILLRRNDRPTRLSAIVGFDDAPIRLEAHFSQAAREEADAAGEVAVRTFLFALGLALQHRTEETTGLVLDQFDFSSKLYKTDPREALAALELSAQLAKLVRLAYAYIHCDIALRCRSTDEVEEEIGRKIVEFAQSYVEERTLDLRPIIAGMLRRTSFAVK